MFFCSVCSAVSPCFWMWTLMPVAVEPVLEVGQVLVRLLTRCGTSFWKRLIWVLIGSDSSTPTPPSTAKPPRYTSRIASPRASPVFSRILTSGIEDQRDGARGDEDQQHRARGARERPQRRAARAAAARAGSSAGRSPAAAGRRPESLDGGVPVRVGRGGSTRSAAGGPGRRVVRAVRSCAVRSSAPSGPRRARPRRRAARRARLRPARESDARSRRGCWRRRAPIAVRLGPSPPEPAYACTWKYAPGEDVSKRRNVSILFVGDVVGGIGKRTLLSLLPAAARALSADVRRRQRRERRRAAWGSRRRSPTSCSRPAST